MLSWGGIVLSNPRPASFTGLSSAFADQREVFYVLVHQRRGEGGSKVV